MKGGHKMSGWLASLEVAAALSQLTLTALLLLYLSPNSQVTCTAVVRPTIFSDLNAPTAAASQAQQQQQQQQQQIPQATQTQQQPAQVNNQQTATAPADGNNHHLHNNQHNHSTKITPFKSRFCTSASGARIDAPLGISSLAIDDLALSASSYSNEQVGPQFARLNLDVSGGAWCPVKPISASNFGKEWIQVKLNRSYVVTGIETQGRYWMGSGKEFTPNYQVEYSRNGGRTWHTWKDLHSAKLLRANEDTNSPVKNELSPPIVGANVIRILPYSQHLRTVCLRFELHGCPYDEGAPIAYATDDGVVEPRWGHLIDYTFDGLRQRAKLSSGLGQLVDGVKGADNFSHNQGFEWVGWKSHNGDVVIEFSFKTVRNFTGALFHSNNLFSSGVEVFQAVDVHYGIDVALSTEALRDSLAEQRRRDATSRTSRQSAAPIDNNELVANSAAASQQTLWSPEVLSIEYEPDKKGEHARQVTVHLKQRLANRLRFVLKFASKWILVSEVEFHSFPVELMSLASLSEQHTPGLLMALSPAKSYDEYVAILREHQLRRIATNAFLESFAHMNGGSSSSSASSSTATSIGSSTSGESQPTVEPGDQLVGDPAQPPPPPPVNQPPTSYEDLFASTSNNRRVTGPAIPAPGWQIGNGFSQQQSDPAAPSVLHQPMLFPPATTDYLPGNAAGAALPDLLAPHQAPAPETSATSRSTTLGLATVISFVLVSILLFLALLFAVSSYRLRQQPKLGSALPRRLASPAKGFMNVFSSGSNHHSNASSGSGANNQHLADAHYNTIFAHTVERPGHRAASTLKRLATMAGSGNHHQQPHLKHQHPLIAQHQQQQQQPNQLLVSLKDSNSQLFGTSQLVGGQKGAHPQSINTQLIVGLNQVNPLAQQQIYNNSSNLNCNNSNQTYATHYSTSMSMASSSTNGHQGDYADYAIPDAQPMIPGIGPQLLQPHQSPQLNHAFNSGNSNHLQQQQQLRQPFGYQTELRASHRGGHSMHQQSFIQPQQLMQPVARQRPFVEHNYEL